MKSYPLISTSAVLLSNLANLVAAQYPLATVYPCLSCPSDVAPPAVTVTAQYQTVSTCTPTPYQVSKGANYTVRPSCVSYAWVSTVIPGPDGSSTTVTKTEQEVAVAHASTVLTSEYPCATLAPSFNATSYGAANASCTSTKLTRLVVDTVVPYNELGPMAIGGYPGSGLCTTCDEDETGTQSQVVTIHQCRDDACSTYAATWVSGGKPTAPISVQSAVYSSSTFCPTSGAYTIPVTATYSPAGPDLTQVVTKTFYITTSVSGPETIPITKTIEITYRGSPAPTVPSSSKLPVSTSAYVTANGAHTVPIYAAITPSDPAYAPVTTTAYYTTAVTDAPVHVYYTTTLTVTFTATAYVQTIVSGVTLRPVVDPTMPASAHARVSAGAYAEDPKAPVEVYPAYSSQVAAGDPITPGAASPAYSTKGPGGYPTKPVPVRPTYTPGGPPPATYGYGNNTLATSKAGASPMATTTGPARDPTTPAACEYSGCYGSSGGFADFTLVESSGYMSVSLCTSECIASGFPYSGLYKESCYCSYSLESSIESGGVCDAPCPGASQHCGGDLSGARYGTNKLLDIYECAVPSSTTASSDATASSTTEPTPDPSSDVDEDPTVNADATKRSLQADMHRAAVAARDGKLRRGGLLRSTEKKETANLIVRRDFGLRRPFGM
ncbi:hypothetical protein QTJ16_007138 [Diplocarpon rosae]|uniref:WSC domain-containing protein n=1 Tax=Diplocarpon rosae TaxID=946125 RepID=A0AAD9WCA3_9HELO|nr:hypothetical protein QTJ16_007138 [Diplocarpon rosae]